jgi:NADPH:quinone reductase
MMKAVEMKEFGKSDVFTLGNPLKPIPKEGEICIRIKAAGFNPVDYKIREGWFAINPHQILGCDCSGIVDSLGPNTHAFSVGDEVYALCSTFFRASNGSYAEYTCVPIELAYKKPKNLSFEEAASIPVAALTAYRASLAAIPFKKEDSVFVAGIGGGVGSFLVQFLKIAGVKKIYTLARNAQSADYIEKEEGIARDHILIYEGLSHEELRTALLQLNGNRLYDVTIDLVGGAIKELCLELTGFSGHFSTTLPESDFLSFDVWSEHALPRARNLSLHQVAVGAELGSPHRKDWQIYQRHFKAISEWIEKGLVKPKTQIVGNLSVESVRKAHDLLESHHVKGKLVISV